MSVMVTYRCDYPGCTAEEELPIEEVLCDEHGAFRPLRSLSGLLVAGWAYEHDGEEVRCPEHRQRLSVQRRREHG